VDTGEQPAIVTATPAPTLPPTPTWTPPKAVSRECNQAFAQAAAGRDLWHTVELLYPALDACESLTEWTGAAQHDRGAIVNDVDPVRFAITACQSYEGRAAAPVCKDLGY
jgi:hypothetical protein